MARIATYAIDATPTLEDKVIGTDVENELITKNYKIGDIIAMVPGGSSSVQSLNTLTGAVNLSAGTNIGLAVDTTKNEIVISSTASAGGITSIEGATGPAIDLAGKGGITISAVGNLINIDGSGISGGTPGAPLNGIQVNVAGSFAAYDYLISNPTSNTLDLGNGSIGKGGSIAGIVNLFNGAGDQNQFGSVRWYDFVSSNNYVGIVGPGSMEKAVSYDIALPGNEPSANQILAVKNGATSSPWELVWTNQSGGSSEDVKFKIEATDGAAGYWRDKVEMGSGLTQTFSTDDQGFKKVQLNQSLPSIVNSIKVGSSTAIGTFEFTGSGVTMTAGVPNVIDFAGGGSATAPAGVAGSVQFNDGTNFSAYTGFTFDKATCMLTLGQSTAPTSLGGILRVEGNGSTYGGKVELETGTSKGTPEIISICGPSSGVKQEIHLPQTVATATTQVLGVKSITGTEVQTEWKASGGALPYTSYEAQWSLSGNSFTLTELNNTTGFTFLWTNNSNGTISITSSAGMGGGVLVFVNGNGGTKEQKLEAFFAGYNGTNIVTLNKLDGTFQNVQGDILSGNFELRIYPV